MVYFILNNLFRVVARYSSTHAPVKGTMNNKLVLYGDDISPPVRFVLMVASLLKTKFDYQHINLFKEENKSSFFKKVNHLQKVPALQIGSDTINDSHAIALYLCHTEGGQNLYPENPLIRARVNQTMFFNSGTLFPIDSYIFTEYFRGQRSINDGKIQEWYSAVDYLEYLLADRMWLACDKVTLADLCCVTTVSSLHLLVPLSDRHVKVKQWLEKLQKISCYEFNARGLERLRNCIHN